MMLHQVFSLKYLAFICFIALVYVLICKGHSAICCFIALVLIYDLHLTLYMFCKRLEKIHLSLSIQLWSGEFWGVKDCGRVQKIPEGLRVWVLPRGFAQHSDLQVNWVTFFLPTLAPWISMFCIIYLRHHQHNNPRMIVYMWSKKFKREMAVCPRDQLYPMAWRLLNNLLPGYLVCL